MTHEPVIQWIRERLATGTIKLNNHTAIRRNPRWKPQWIVKLHGKRAQLLCRRLLPYLIVKKEHAKLILEFPCECRRGPDVPIPAEIVALRVRLHAAMRALNQRGPA